MVSHGYCLRNAKNYAPVNLDRIQHWIDQGRLTSSPESPITARDLLKSGCVHNVHDGIKLLGDVSSALLGMQYLNSSLHRVPNISNRPSISLPLEQVKAPLLLLKRGVGK